MNYIDILPLDVIRVHIFPCLDYNSRANLMQLLKPEERWEISKYYRISPKNILYMELKFRMIDVFKALKACDYNEYHANSSVRLQNICNLFDTMKKHIVIIQYYMSLREAFLDKLTDCLDTSRRYPDDNDYYGVLAERATKILELVIDRYPFLYQFIGSNYKSGWPDGIGPVINP